MQRLAILLGMLIGVTLCDSAGAYYHAQLGRFVSRDPIGILGGRNLYNYVDGEVTGNTDPSGLAKFKCQCRCQTAGPFMTGPPGISYTEDEVEAEDQTEANEACDDLCETKNSRVGSIPHRNCIRFVPADTKFFLRREQANDPCAKGLGFQHVDLCHEDFGVCRIGLGGAAARGIPKPPDKNDWPLKRRNSGWLVDSNGKKRRCENVTPEEIDTCLRNYPVMSDTSGVNENCQTDCYRAATQCCLESFPFWGLGFHMHPAPGGGYAPDPPSDKGPAAKEDPPFRWGGA